VVPAIVDSTSELAATRIEARSTEDVHLSVRGRAVHTLIEHGASITNASSPAVAELLGTSTGRNAKVVTAIAERWC
jgi:hypothetical protein